MKTSKYNFNRRGSVYIAVLGVSTIVATLAIGGIIAARAQARSNEANGDMAEARLYAQSGLELAKLWIYLDANWRTNHPNGTWTSSMAIGSGTMSISVTDPTDGDLTNRQYDTAVVSVTGYRRQAMQTLQQTLTATGTPIPALQYALHTGGQLDVASGMHLIVGSGTVSTNGSLYSKGTVEGNGDVGSSASSGIFFGTLTTGSATKAMPASGMDETYARLGTLISPGSATINKAVLSPALNPWGSGNADGVYVIRSSQDITISNTRINGTLVIVAPGKTVTISGQVLFQPSRSDYPALIVNGNLVLQYSSASSMSESSLGTNLNPSGAPYQGVSDSDTTDSYPSEIQGLVHIIGGTLTVSQPCTIRGAVICESTASTNAVYINASTFQIAYDKSLYTNPQFYTTSVQMTPQSGSLKQVVN